MSSLLVFFALQILFTRADLTPTRLFDFSDLRQQLPDDDIFEIDDRWNSPRDRVHSIQCAYSPLGRSCFPWTLNGSRFSPLSSKLLTFLTYPQIQIKLAIFAFMHASISVDEVFLTILKNNGLERAFEKRLCFWNLGRFHLTAFYQCNKGRWCRLCFHWHRAHPNWSRENVLDVSNI